MPFKLLRQAIKNRSENIRIFQELQKTKDISIIKNEPILQDVELQFNQKWWLETAFNKIHLSFNQGVILVYALFAIPRLLFTILIFGVVDQNFFNNWILGFITDVYPPLALVLLNSIYKSLIELKNQTNYFVNSRKFLAPSWLIKETELVDSKKLLELDESYQNSFIKPVELRSLQNGLDLVFDLKYQLGSGLISSLLMLLIIYLRYFIEVIPSEFFSIANIGVPNLITPHHYLTFYIMGIAWFAVGLFAWSMFLTLLIVIQSSGYTMNFRPFESLKTIFAPVTTLALKLFFFTTFVVTSISPLVIIFSMISEDVIYRQSVVNYTGSILLFVVPIVIFSFIIPINYIHKGMEGSRNRAIKLKLFQLNDLKKNKSKINNYFFIQSHLIEDFKSIQDNPEWVLNFTQIFEVIGTIVLPVFTFIISVII